MKKLFIALAIVLTTIISTSCTEQHKVKTNVKRYIGKENELLDFTFNDSDTIYTFNEGVKLLKQINELVDEYRHYHILAINEFRYGSISIGNRYSKECDDIDERETELWSRLKEEKPIKHIFKTATVTYRDSKGCTNTEKFVISEYNTIDCTVSSLGASLDDYKQMLMVLASNLSE